MGWNYVNVLFDRNYVEEQLALQLKGMRFHDGRFVFFEQSEPIRQSRALLEPPNFIGVFLIDPIAQECRLKPQLFLGVERADGSDDAPRKNHCPRSKSNE